jgi:predicted RNase H-like nuclease
MVTGSFTVSTPNRPSRPKQSPRCVGIDGCRAGWVAATAGGHSAAVWFDILDNAALAKLFAEALAGDIIIAIDVPIGLADNAPRACDGAARSFLSPYRTASVFSAPCRATLVATNFDQARALNHQARGKGINQQTFGILPKIRMIDQLMTPQLQLGIYEAHPEVTFAGLAVPPARRPRSSKRRRTGLHERITILQHYIPSINEAALRRERCCLGRKKLALDDLVDATACLLTAQRIAQRQAVSLPSTGSQIDARGLRMEIVW